MRQVIAFVGISGVGKSFFLKRAITDQHAVVVSASKIIAEQRERQGEVAVHDELRLANLDTNQSLLVQGFRQLREDSKPIILDSHTLIDAPAGEVEVPAEVFAHLGVTDFVVLVDDPVAILARRDGDSGRSRPKRSVEEITSHQRRASEVAAKICGQLNLPITVIGHSDGREFLKALGC